MIGKSLGELGIETQTDSKIRKNHSDENGKKKDKTAGKYEIAFFIMINISFPVIACHNICISAET